mgnify:FL=1
MFDYNTGRESLMLREFGRNVQKLANHLMTIEDEEKRSRYAAGIIELMKQVVPSIKDTPEDNQRLWDDLHIMTNFELDVKGPYDKPEAHLQTKKPGKVAYNYHKIGFRHYGFNLELMVEEAMKMEDPEQRESAIVHIGKLMKSYHATWNKEVVDDEVIIKNIGLMSDGALTIDIEKVKEEGLFEPLYKEKIKQHTPSRYKKGNGHKSQKRRRSN